MITHVKAVIGVGVIASLLLSCTAHKTEEQKLEAFFDKRDVTILVTDSGLGGLSVAADVAARLPGSGVFAHARIVFFNALFHERSGYNSLDSEAEKIRIFDIVLEAMADKYKPDLLLIACNTLSVLYEGTNFAAAAPFPVVGIVETGVECIAAQFEKMPEATAIIFATLTTIGAGSHKNLLVERGFSTAQIIGQPCHRLAGAIERGYNSSETTGLIREFVPQALQGVTRPDTPLFASLNCTHYGYSLAQFRQVFAEHGYDNIVIIDPNPKMSDFLFAERYLHRHPQTRVSVEVVSKTTVSEEKRKSLGSLLALTSPLAAAALRDYTYDPDLFAAKFDTMTIGR